MMRKENENRSAQERRSNQRDAPFPVKRQEKATTKETCTQKAHCPNSKWSRLIDGQIQKAANNTPCRETAAIPRANTNLRHLGSLGSGESTGLFQSP
jgi:hypothetical protein